MVKSAGAFVAETGLKDSFVWMVAGALFFFGGMVGCVRCRPLFRGRNEVNKCVKKEGKRVLFWETKIKTNKQRNRRVFIYRFRDRVTWSHKKKVNVCIMEKGKMKKATWRSECCRSGCSILASSHLH